MIKLLDLYRALGITDFEYNEIVSRLGREPNKMELYLFSAMWSEHCGYMHSRKYISQLPIGGAICEGENAGGIQIGDHIVVFKVESHNHPSAVEPFQGAATGIGGIIRDILAIGARPIALLDSLKFGNIENPLTRHLLDGVVDGISSYGNSIGVPTVAGEVGFDDSYTDSPLVNVMAVGLVHKDKIQSAKGQPNNTIIAVGSATGRDGINGASFASKELSEESKEDRPSVQIGDPFTKKVLIEATLEILEISGVVSCQDFGAAGLLSSSSEIAYSGGCGIDLHLDKVHLREPDMQPWEIMLSESQERMLFIVQDDSIKDVITCCKKYDLPYSVIGSTNETNDYKLFWNGQEIANVPPEVLCRGPVYDLCDEEPQYIAEYKNMICENKIPLEKVIEKVLSDPNFASKKWIYRQYDHTVGNRTSIKPGEAGSAGIWIEEEGGVIGLTIDSNGRQVFLDPYNGSRNIVWEGCRNLISSGFVPRGITNCLNYGNPEKPEVAYQFVKSIEGITQSCHEAKIPVVSGNVSFYNESPNNRVFPTPTIGIVGYTESYNNLIRNSFVENEEIFLIGKSISDDSNIGGSLYQRCVYDFLGGIVDEVDSQLEQKLAKAILDLKASKLLSGCIDISEGGLFGALFEALNFKKLGFVGNLIHIKDQEKALFGEITGRFLVSTSKAVLIQQYFNENDISYKYLGKCTGKKLEFNGYSFDINYLSSLYTNSIESEMSA